MQSSLSVSKTDDAIAPFKSNDPYDFNEVSPSEAPNDIERVKPQFISKIDTIKDLNPCYLKRLPESYIRVYEIHTSVGEFNFSHFIVIIVENHHIAFCLTFFL